MVNKFIIDFVLKRALLVLAKKIKPLEKYVYEDNELDVEVKRLRERQDLIEQELTEIKKRK